MVTKKERYKYASMEKKWSLLKTRRVQFWVLSLDCYLMDSVETEAEVVVVD